MEDVQHGKEIIAVEMGDVQMNLPDLCFGYRIAFAACDIVRKGRSLVPGLESVHLLSTQWVRENMSGLSGDWNFVPSGKRASVAHNGAITINTMRGTVNIHLSRKTNLIEGISLGGRP